MNSKKKAPAAQQLIDSLLDELPLLSKKKPVKGSASSSRSSIQRGPRELVFTPDNNSSGEIILEDGQRITIRDEDTNVPGQKKVFRAKPAADAKVQAPGTVVQPIKSLKEKNDEQLLAQFRKNVEADPENSILFDGELGQEGTATLIRKSGDPVGLAKKEPAVDNGDPLFASTKVIDITSSQSKSNSVHIHSLNEIGDDQLGPGVDLLVEAMEITNPAFKNPARVLPKSESTPRSEIADAPQMVENESHEDLVRKPTDSVSLEADSNEINLDIDEDAIFKPEQDAHLMIASEHRNFNALPLNQHEISIFVKDDQIQGNPLRDTAAAQITLSPVPMDEHLQYSSAELESPENKIESKVDAKAEKNPQGQALPQNVVSSGSKAKAKDLLHKEMLAFESGRAVLDRVLARVRGAGPAEKNDSKSKPVNPQPAPQNEPIGETRGAADDASHLVELSHPPLADLSENTTPMIRAHSSEDISLSTPARPRLSPSVGWTQQNSAAEVSHDEKPALDNQQTEMLGGRDNQSRETDVGAAGDDTRGASQTADPQEPSKQGPLDTLDRMMATQIRPGAAKAREQQVQFASQGKENPQAGRPANANLSGNYGGNYGVNYGVPSFHSAEASLKQSESLRIAQTRISDLEQELERIRRENEKLASAGETLRRHSDELRARAENAEQDKRESERIRDEERKVMRGQMSQKDRENIESRQRLEEAEGRLESNFKKIRVRERELEHRLEIMKMESATLVSTKDKMILDLKRQLDQLAHENEYGKQKAQEAFAQYKGKQETQRRVVRALRIALTILEGDDENVVVNKKAE